MEWPGSPVHPRSAALALPPGNNVLMSPAHSPSCRASWSGWLHWQEGGPWRLSPGSWHPHPKASSPPLPGLLSGHLSKYHPRGENVPMSNCTCHSWKRPSVPLHTGSSPPMIHLTPRCPLGLALPWHPAGMPVCGRPDMSALYVKCTPTETTRI